MSQVFNTQTMLQLQLDTGITLTDATAKKILWQDPEGGKGEFEATGTSGTKLLYDVQETDITLPGDWKFQAAVEIGGKWGYGQIVKQNFKALLTA